VQVGDLVTMSESSVERSVTGIIISTEPPKSLLKSKPSWYNCWNRVGVLWAYGGGRIDWEPRDWLEVISESR